MLKKSMLKNPPNSSMTVLNGTNPSISALQKHTVLQIQMFANHSESLLVQSFLICQF